MGELAHQHVCVTTLLSCTWTMVHSGCTGDMSVSSSEEEEEEEETEEAEGGLEMLVAGKRLEEVRPHICSCHTTSSCGRSLFVSPLTFFSLLSLFSPLKACQTEEGLSNVAAAAEQFQPKGITLATTEVRTSVLYKTAIQTVRI